MNMLEAVKSGLTKAFSIKGRARRSEYWWFYLATAIVSGVLSLIGVGLGFIPMVGWVLDIFVGLAVLALNVPLITAGIRRLHDVGKSGWWMLLLLACCAGLLIIFFHVKDSDPGENEYGPNPKDVKPEKPAEAAKLAQPVQQPVQDEAPSNFAYEPVMEEATRIVEEPTEEATKIVEDPAEEATRIVGEPMQPVQPMAPMQPVQPAAPVPPVMPVQKPASSSNKPLIYAGIAVGAAIIGAVVGTVGYFVYKHMSRFDRPVYETFTEKELQKIYADEKLAGFDDVYQMARYHTMAFTKADSIHYRDLTYKMLWEYQNYVNANDDQLTDDAIIEYTNKFILPSMEYLNADVEKWSEYIEKYSIDRYINVSVNETYEDGTYLSKYPAFYFTIDYVSDEVTDASARVNLVGVFSGLQDSGLTPSDFSLLDMKTHTSPDNDYYYQRDNSSFWESYNAEIVFNSVTLKNGTVISPKDMGKVPDAIRNYILEKDEYVEETWINNLRANTIREMYSPDIPDYFTYIEEYVENDYKSKFPLAHEFWSREDVEEDHSVNY